MHIRTLALIVGLTALGWTSPAMAREVYIPDWGMVEVDNEHFIELQSKTIPSSQISRMFYDSANRYLLANVHGIFVHFCTIPQSVIDDWLASTNPNQYYRDNVEGSYDCRVNPPPDYRK